MDNIHTYSALDELASADVNEIQKRAVGLLVASGGDANDLSALPAGAIMRVWQLAADMADKTHKTVDKSVDWSDRLVFVVCRTSVASNVSPGAGGDSDFDSLGTSTLRLAYGYTGKGALNVSSTAVADGAGNEPAPAYTTSWVVRIAAGLYLYADPYNANALCIYNDTGSTIKEPHVMVLATERTGKRP